MNAATTRTRLSMVAIPQLAPGTHEFAVTAPAGTVFQGLAATPAGPALIAIEPVVEAERVGTHESRTFCVLLVGMEFNAELADRLSLVGHFIAQIDSHGGTAVVCVFEIKPQRIVQPSQRSIALVGAH